MRTKVNFNKNKAITIKLIKKMEELKGILNGANKHGSGITLDELILWNNAASLDYPLSKLEEYLKDIPEIERKYKNTLNPKNAKIKIISSHIFQSKLLNKFVKKLPPCGVVSIDE